MNARVLLALAVATATAGCVQAQQPASTAGPRGTTEVVELPQPPATAYVGLETTVRLPGGRPIVRGVAPRSPAATAGFAVGDTLLVFEGQDTQQRLPNLRMLTPGRRYTVQVKRGAETPSLVLIPGPPRPED